MARMMGLWDKVYVRQSAGCAEQLRLIMRRFGFAWLYGCLFSHLPCLCQRHAGLCAHTHVRGSYFYEVCKSN